MLSRKLTKKIYKKKLDFLDFRKVKKQK